VSQPAPCRGLRYGGNADDVCGGLACGNGSGRRPAPAVVAAASTRSRHIVNEQALHSLKGSDADKKLGPSCLRVNVTHSTSEQPRRRLCLFWLGDVVVRASVGLVIKRSRVRFPACALPGSLGQLSLPSLPER